MAALYGMEIPHSRTSGVAELNSYVTATGDNPISQLKDNLERVEEAIEQACRRAGRPRREVELMAVSKTYPTSTIIDAVRLGLRVFGENRVQEFASKTDVLVPWRANGVIAASDVPVRVHLIGHLQSNKAAKAAELFDAIDSLDSIKLAERLDEAAGKLRKRLPVLIEIKLSSEETKEGLEPHSIELAQLLERMPDFTHLQLRGLMTIAPWGVAEEVTRACFRSLRDYRDRWATIHPNLNLNVLSMGMSGDFEAAIACGSTHVRIGTAIFGVRDKIAG